MAPRALDHVSLTIKGWDECLERVKKLGYDWRAAIVPGTSLWQIFVHDPSGVMMELTFDGKAENRPTPEIPADRVYHGRPAVRQRRSRRRRRLFTLHLRPFGRSSLRSRAKRGVSKRWAATGVVPSFETRTARAPQDEVGASAALTTPDKTSGSGRCC